MSLPTFTQRVLVTGSSGAIGQPVCHYLQARGHQVRGFDRHRTPGLADFFQGDLTDREQVQAAVADMETVIHLAAYPNDADFIDVLLEPNVRGLYHVCDAARQAGVKRLVLASSIQVISGHGRREGMTIRSEDGAKPTNHYALTKVWAETMGEMYARCYNLAVINVRIGWFPRNLHEAQRLAAAAPFGPNVFFSHNDAQRFFICCVEAAQPDPGQAVTVFAASQPQTFPRLDLEPARRILGYEPQDRWREGLPFAV
jgi:nucleoside-diphosphate-sugar epimerase